MAAFEFRNVLPLGETETDELEDSGADFLDTDWHAFFSDCKKIEKNIQDVRARTTTKIADLEDERPNLGDFAIFSRKSIFLGSVGKSAFHSGAESLMFVSMTTRTSDCCAFYCFRYSISFFP